MQIGGVRFVHTCFYMVGESVSVYIQYLKLRMFEPIARLRLKSIPCAVGLLRGKAGERMQKQSIQ